MLPDRSATTLDCCQTLAAPLLILTRLLLASPFRSSLLLRNRCSPSRLTLTLIRLPTLPAPLLILARLLGLARLGCSVSRVLSRSTGFVGTAAIELDGRPFA